MNYDGTERCFYTRGDELISQERDGKKSYYFYDGHGSVRALADDSGKVTDTYNFDAFGNLISSVGSTKNDFLFCGEQFDPVTGLYYLRARYMNTSVGTFISMDTYSGSIDDPVSLHKYLYANADPVNKSDPSGYATASELATTTGMQSSLNATIVPNGKALLDMVGGIFEVVRDTASAVIEGIELGYEGPQLAMHIASGFITSLATNFSCMLTKLGPIGYVIMGVAALVIGIVAVAAFASGDTELGLTQIANLVSIVFSMFNPSCFTGDTEVYTSDGFVCIEEVQVGDEVWAYNSETGATELKEVLNIWIKETDEILHVSTSDGETIDTTTNHPFYVEEKGWVAAGDLEVGDLLYTADGDEVEVTDIELEKLAESIIVYNLEVEDFHTYFVGEYGVLVHNAGCNYRDNFEEYTGHSATGHVHHGLPQEEWLQEIFKSLGIDINDGKYLFDIPKENHISKIGEGIHTNSSKAGMTWNAAWKKFFNENFGPYTKKQIEDQLDKMAELFGISMFRATPKI